MDRINSIQLDINMAKTQSQDKQFKKHMWYLKERDKKVHKMTKNMMNVLSKFNITMFHAFIKDHNLMALPINLSYSLFDDQSTINNQDIVEE
jgi:hypothetical protein